MKKRLTSLLAWLCVVILVCGSAIPAFAQDAQPDNSDQVATAPKAPVPSVKISVKAANKKQYFKYTGKKWSYFPVSYNGTGPSAASTTKNIKKTEYLTDCVNYDILWDKNHKTTTVKFVLDKTFKGTVQISDRCRHMTWGPTVKPKVFNRIVTPKGREISYTFSKSQLQYEDHTVIVTAYSNATGEKVVAGQLKIHVHVRDKGEQIVDSACRYLGRISYSNRKRLSVNKSTRNLSDLNKTLPKRCYADCSSFVSHIYYLHGLWSGKYKRGNYTRIMGPNARKRPKGMKRKVALSYQNMGCVWLVANRESGHRYAHAAIMVGNNYYINVTEHTDTKVDLGKWANSCFQKCTKGSRNYAVKEVYDYRSW